jgi:hypothetical protein
MTPSAESLPQFKSATHRRRTLRVRLAGMRKVRRSGAALVAIVLWLAVGACGGDESGNDRASSGDTPGADSFPLPFGLEQLEGTEPIGRPAVYDTELYTYNGAPVRGRVLRAAYRVTGDDPPAVLRAWVAQLDGLALDELSIRPRLDGPPSLWMQANQRTPGNDSDEASADLWVTSEGPILQVSAARKDRQPPRRPTVTDDAGSPPAPEAADVGTADREAGDVLFTEQGNDIHLPEGTRPLAPTIETFCGTGGSTTMLAAEDGEAAVQAMVDEGLAHDADGHAGDPEVIQTDGTEVVTGGYTRDAGGWSFSATSVEGPGDPYATVYVSSCAD